MSICPSPFSEEPALNGVIDSEMRELEEAAKKSKLSLKDYIKQQLQPLQDKLRSHPNQLVTALLVGVESVPFKHTFPQGGTDYHNQVSKNLYVGATTEDTSLRPFVRNSSFGISFLTGLQFALVHDMSNSRAQSFFDLESKQFGQSFHRADNPEDVDLVFMDREDPRVPHAGGFEYVERKIEGKPPLPRLSIAIGSEAVSVLEDNLAGYQCAILARLVDAKGFPFPFTPAMTEKFVREERELYLAIVKGEKNKTDLAYEAKSRGYDNNGIDFRVNGDGVSSIVSAREFFNKYIKQHARN